MEVDSTIKACSSSAQPFASTPGNHLYKLYAISTSPARKPLFKSQDSRSYERKMLLLLSEKRKGSLQEEVLMTGLEVHEYYMIKEETLNIYISKVDTTGCTPSPNIKNVRATKQLISSYINYHLEERIHKHVNIHVFARSQPQYLFTKSSENPTKHVLSDVDLLKWWKKVLEQTFSTTNNSLHGIKKWYYVPGNISESKVRLLYRDGKDWIYGYPYDNESKANDVIPKFDDDAKARWLNHLDNNDDIDEIDNTTVKEFWEMISIGSEFSCGKVAGFFWIHIECLTRKDLKDEGYESLLLKNLTTNVGGIVFDEQEFIDVIQKFFDLDFCNEEFAFKASKYWCKNFNDSCTQKGINDGVLEFVVGLPQNEPEELSTQGSVIAKRKCTVIENDDSNSISNDASTNKVNVLSPSLIKRVKK
ncbi:16135_t:CDS:2 [Funneliformis geosporum]|uniref:histone acetyltransferase n=1 Tax=Funneliformis geosporum TaxID=1117311 RepID=A0A9W4SUA7_9GLOM|nr:16135_t:CDS:2 [Funneliformis geosporum]CAI2181713.1 2554_t:CDS:2 [Funneliformis geosporum]